MGGTIIVGARSSLLLPFKILSLIIVDEEHENSFKQLDPAPDIRQGIVQFTWHRFKC